MYLQSIQVDGFKSYSGKTTIGPFSANFNCISGLNGSGKSNILDAITFVIGCKDLSLMRCTHLSDLIYKQGNAHVKRASVSLIFNNQDKTKSPIGFDNLDEITITRVCSLPNKTKYLLNGNSINNIQIQSLFASIGLNPATPNNYIIFQGKITKIIMMKPHELSLLLKEAAGTLHYEQRKDNASKVLNKKNVKVQEISDTLENEVLPKIKEYQQQRNDYLALKQLSVELEEKIKFIINLEFTMKSNHLEQITADFQSKQSVLNNLNANKAMLESQLSSICNELKLLKKTSLIENKSLSAQYKSAKLELAKCESNVNFITKDINQLQLDKEQEFTTLNQFQSKLDELTTNKQSVESDYNSAKLVKDNALAKLNILSSMANGELDVELERIDQLLKHATNEVILIQNKIDLLQQEWNGYHEKRYLDATSKLSELESAKNRIVQSSLELVNKSSDKQFHLDDYESQIQVLTGGYVAQQGQYKQELQLLNSDKKSISSKVDKIRNDLNQIKRPLRSIYSVMELPLKYPNLKGLVGCIGSFIKCDSKYHLAISIAGGARLKHIVVERDEVAAYILKNIRLEQRQSFVPLNTLNTKPMNAAKLKLAKQLSNNSIYSIHDIIEYPIEYKQVIDYCFGNVLFCTNSKMAEQVSFNKQILIKCVTLDGDVYDPSGTVSGGSAPRDLIISRFQDLQVLQVDYEQYQHQLKSIDAKIESTSNLLASSVRIHDELVQQQQQYMLICSKITKGELNLTISNSKDHLDELNRHQDLLNKQKLQVEHFKQAQEYSNSTSTNASKSDLAVKQKEYSAAESIFKKQSALFDQFMTELDQLSINVKESNKTISGFNDQLQSLRNQLKLAQTEYNSCQLKFNAIDMEYNESLSLTDQYKQQLQQLLAQEQLLNQQLNDLVLQQQECEHGCSVWEQEIGKTNRRIKELAKSDPELIDIQSGYDLLVENELLLKMQQQHNLLKLNVNQQVMSMIDVAEQEELKLATMLTQVQADKCKIEGAIEELDKHKLTAVEQTWREVTDSFGKILSGILPGSTAKLIPLPSGVVEGCEIGIELNGKWKESLSELSGGQRSLVAISLILSLLQFKTSPLYILDEVDAGILH
eukprot:NODE_238_length_13323_cov_0.463854.p1 type:complete len:1102 gc:universal NODE_238_length_13323_cov_0.463854:13109-9804(-)